MRLRRQVRNTTTGQWAPKQQATTDPAGTVTETNHPSPRCPHCGERLSVEIRAAEAG